MPSLQRPGRLRMKGMDVVAIIGAVAAFFVAFLLALLVRLFARPLRLVAAANARSSHEGETPTGGGLGIVVALLAWFALAARFGEGTPASTLLVNGIVVAIIGLLDDLEDQSRTLRLVCQLVAAGICVAWLFHTSLWFDLALILLAVWFVNLYNFMDGIDGLAASQGAAFALGVLVMGDANLASGTPLVLLGACAGFLCLNWAPARVFMGDVCSGFLGLVVFVLALWLHTTGEFHIAASAVVLAVFWFDATWTLCVRIVTGQRFMEAHRSHLYQIISRRLGHGATTGLFWAYWALWLLPLAWAVGAWPELAPAFVALACIPLAIASVRLRAGRDNG